MLGVSVTENRGEGAAASVNTAAGTCIIQVRRAELCIYSEGSLSKSRKGKQFRVEPLVRKVISVLELVWKKQLRFFVVVVVVVF